MKYFCNGVSYYTKATMEIGFPEDRVACVWCPMMAHDYKVVREICKKTGEILPAPYDYIGFNCPLKFEKENNNEHL